MTGALADPSVDSSGSDTGPLESTTAFGASEIFVRTWAHTSPTAVLVLAHGYAEHSAYWDTVAAQLGVMLGVDVVAPDLPGHGRSDGARGIVNDVDDLVAAFGHVVHTASADRPGLPVIIMGHSMGGLVATRYTQLHRDQVRLLIAHAAGVMPTGNIPVGDAINAPGAMTVDPELAAFIEKDALRVTGPMSSTTRDALTHGAEAALSSEPLNDIPLIWLHGKDDALLPYATARRSSERLGADHTAFLGYPNRGHGGLLEHDNGAMMRDLANAVTMARGG